MWEHVHRIDSMCLVVLAHISNSNSVQATLNFIGPKGQKQSFCPGSHAPLHDHTNVHVYDVILCFWIC